MPPICDSIVAEEFQTSMENIDNRDNQCNYVSNRECFLPLKPQKAEN